MQRNYRWLGLGGEYSPEDRDLFRRFMKNALVANSVLDNSVDADGWRAETGLSALYLVLGQDRSHEEPNISSVSLRAGVRTFSVEFDWLTPALLDRNLGPWQALGTLSVVLSTLGAEAGLVMPTFLRIGRFDPGD